jgi:hypothetical protein
LGFAQAITDAKGLEKLLISVLEKRAISKSAIEAQVFNFQGKIYNKIVI